jgi:hypothetical protein
MAKELSLDEYNKMLESMQPKPFEGESAYEEIAESQKDIEGVDVPLAEGLLKSKQVYGIGDLAYDMIIDPAATGIATVSDLSTNLLLGLDRLAIDMENQARADRGDPLVDYGTSGFGQTVKKYNTYIPKQVVDQFKKEIEAAREIEDPQDRYEVGKRILGEYGSAYAYTFGALEIGKRLPFVKVIAKPLDKALRRQILKNPVSTLGVELTGVAAETEAAVRGASELQQMGVGVGTTLLTPTVGSAAKKYISRQLAGDVVKNMKPKDFQKAAEILQQVVDPETSLANLNKILEEGTLPANVKAPLEILLGDRGFTHLESVLNKRFSDVTPMTLRDQEYLQAIKGILAPVTEGSVRNAEDWIRLSKQMFNKNINETTSHMIDEGLEQLNKVKKNLPEPEEIARSFKSSLAQSKADFDQIVNDAWDAVDQTQKLPIKISDDFNIPLKGSLDITLTPENILGNINRMAKDPFSNLIPFSPDYALRLNTEQLLDSNYTAKLRQAVVEGSGGNTKVIKKFDDFMKTVEEIDIVKQRIATDAELGDLSNVTTEELLSMAPQASKSLKLISGQMRKEYSTNTMKAIEELVNDYGLENMPKIVQDVLDGTKQINTIGDLYNLRKVLGVVGMGAMKQGQVNTPAYITNKIRSAILDDMVTLKGKSATLRRAVNYSADYNRTFKDGLVGRILSMTADGAQQDPSTALKNVFQSAGTNFNFTGKLNVQSILDAAKKVGVTKAGAISRKKNTEVEKQLQNYMLNLFSKQAVKDVEGVGKVIDRARADAFYQKYAPILDLPEMKRAKGIVLNASGPESNIAKYADEKVSLKKVYAKFFGSESLGAVNLFMQGDITEGVTKMLLAKGGIQDLKELKRLVNEAPAKYFTELGITRQDVQQGIKDSVKLAMVNIGEAPGKLEFSSLAELVKNPGRVPGSGGAALPFLKEAGFSSAEIKNIQKFAGEIQKYNRYLVSRGKIGEDFTKGDNLLYSLIGLFIGGTGADFFSSSASLAAASYIKRQTTQTLERLSRSQAHQVLSDAMSDPKLLKALLETPTVYNKNRLPKARPYLFKYLAGRGLENAFSPDDEEIADRMDYYKSNQAPSIVEGFLEGLESQANVRKSTIDSLLEVPFTDVRIDRLPPEFTPERGQDIPIYDFFSPRPGR